MIQIVRFCTLVSAIGVIGAMGGYEQGVFGFGGMLVRMLVFCVLTGVCVVADEILTQRKRAKRRAILKAQRNK